MLSSWLLTTVLFLAASQSASSEVIDYTNSLPPGHTIRIQRSTQSVAVRNVIAMSSSLTIQIEDLWYDPALPSSAAEMPIVLIDVRVSHITVTSSSPPTVGGAMDACQQYASARPAATLRLRRLVISLEHTSGVSVSLTPVMHTVTGMLLCNASVTFRSLQNSHVSLSSCGLAYAAVQIIAAESLRVDIQAPLVLRNTSSVTVDVATRVAFLLSHTGDVLLDSGSIVALRNSSLVEDGVAVSGNGVFNISSASRLMVSGNRCASGLSCGIALQLKNVVVSALSRLDVSSNSIVGVESGPRPFPSVLLISWTSMVVLEGSLVHVDDNMIHASGAGLSFIGSEVIDRASLNISSRSVVSVSYNRVVFSTDTVDLAGSIFDISIQTPQYYGAGVAVAVTSSSLLRVARNTVTHTSGGSGDVSVDNIIRFLITGSLLCSDEALIQLGVNSTAVVAGLRINRGAVLHSVSRNVSVSSQAAVYFGGLGESILNSAVMRTFSGVCGTVVVSGALHVVDGAMFTVSGYHCSIRVPECVSPSLAWRSLVAVSLEGTVRVAGSGSAFFVALNDVSVVSAACAAAMSGVLLTFASSVTVEQSGSILVSKNVVSTNNVPCAAVGIAVLLGDMSPVVLSLATGGVVSVSNNTVSDWRCGTASGGPRDSVCGGVLLRLAPSSQVQLSFAAALMLAENNITLNASLGVLFDRRLLPGTPRYAFENISVIGIGFVAAASSTMTIQYSSMLTFAGNVMNMSTADLNTTGVALYSNMTVAVQHDSAVVVSHNDVELTTHCSIKNRTFFNYSLVDSSVVHTPPIGKQLYHNGSSVSVSLNRLSLTCALSVYCVSGSNVDGVQWFGEITASMTSSILFLLNNISAASDGWATRAVKLQSTNKKSLVLAYASRLLIEENQLNVSNSYAVWITCDVAGSSATAPAALSVLYNSGLSVSMNVMSSNRLWRYSAVYIEALNSEGLAIAVWSGSYIGIDSNDMSAPISIGVYLRANSKFTTPVAAAVTSGISEAYVALISACSFVKGSALSVSRNIMRRVSTGILVDLTITYYGASLSGSTPKGLVVAIGSSVVLKENYVDSDGSYGLYIRVYLSPSVAEFSATPIASASISDKSTLSVLNNRISSSYPFRWYTYSTIGANSPACSCTVDNPAYPCPFLSGVICTNTYSVSFYTSTIVAGSSSILLVANVFLGRHSSIPSVIIDHSFGRAHTATLSGSSVLSISRNVILSGGDTGVSLFQCVPSFSGDCRTYGNPPETLSENTPPNIVLIKSTMQISGNGITMPYLRQSVNVAAFWLLVQALYLSQASVVTIEGNLVEGNTSCIVVQGLIDSSASRFRVQRNKCDSTRLLTLLRGSLPQVCTKCITVRCDTFRSRMLLNETAYATSIVKEYDGILVGSCQTFSFTRTPTRSPKRSTSKSPAFSVSLLPAASASLNETMSMRLHSVTNGSTFSESQDPSNTTSTSLALVSWTLRISHSSTRRPTVTSVALATPSNTFSWSASRNRMSMSENASVSFSEKKSASQSTTYSAEGTTSKSCAPLRGVPSPFFGDLVVDDRELPQDSFGATVSLGGFLMDPRRLLVPTSSQISTLFARLMVSSQRVVGNGQNYSLNVVVVGPPRSRVTLAVNASVSPQLLTTTQGRDVLGSGLLQLDVNLGRDVDGEHASQPTRFAFHFDQTRMEEVQYVPGDVFTVLLLSSDMILDSVVCPSDVTYVPVVHLQLGHGISDAQLVLRKSLEGAMAGSVFLNLFSGDVSDDLSVLAFTGLMACARRDASNGFGSLNILAPLLMYNTFASVIYSNVLLVVVVVLMQVFAVVALYVIVWRFPGSPIARHAVAKHLCYEYRRTTGDHNVTTRMFELARSDSITCWPAPFDSSGGAGTPLWRRLFSVRPLVVTINRDEDVSLVTAKDLCLIVEFPGVSVSAALSVYPGTLFAGIRLLQLYGTRPGRDGTPGAFDVSLGGLVLGIVCTIPLLPMPLFLYWLASRCISRSYHQFTVPLGESRNAYTIKYRVFSFLRWLEPRGKLFPTDVPKTWGPLVSSSLPSGLWAVSNVIGGWILCVAALTQFYVSDVFCSSLFVVLAVVNAGLGVAVTVYTPRRSKALSYLTAVMLFVSVVTLIMSAVTAFDDSIEVGSFLPLVLGFCQAICTLMKSVAGLCAVYGVKLQMKRNTAVIFLWSIGALCTEATVANTTHDSRRRRLQRLQDMLRDTPYTSGSAKQRVYAMQVVAALKKEGLWHLHDDGDPCVTADGDGAATVMSELCSELADALDGALMQTDADELLSDGDEDDILHSITNRRGPNDASRFWQTVRPRGLSSLAVEESALLRLNQSAASQLAPSRSDLGMMSDAQENPVDDFLGGLLAPMPDPRDDLAL